MLCASVKAAGAQDAEAVDLEILLASLHATGEPCLLYERELDVSEVLEAELVSDVAAYGDLLAGLAGVADADAVGISVMGHPQLASALLLARMALGHGCRVIFGGQFWTGDSALHAIDALAPFGAATVTTGDGWDAIASFARGEDRVPPNSYARIDGEVVAGPRTGRAVPPQPDYSDAAWEHYAAYASRIYRRTADTRRCHVYIWDRICNFRCAFCRVASGSKATLAPPDTALASIEHLLDAGVTQMNFMTNELNPSRTYMLRFLDGLDERLARSGRSDGPAVHWLSYVRADSLEPSDLQLFRRVGGRFARYGVESGSQRLLDLMRKDYDVATIERTLRHAADADVWNHTNLLIGFPGEREDDVDRTCTFLERNAQRIHSVRINPFYLPPDTPIARTPEEFGIRLTHFRKGWWDYELLDGSAPDPEAVVARIDRVSQACVDLDISFAGNDPFLLLELLSRHDGRDAARGELRERFPFFWDARPPAFYQAMVGGYEVSAAWQDTALRRGENYSLAFCTD